MTDHPSRIAITGSSGLYGRALLGEIRRRLPEARVLGVDIRAADACPPDDVLSLDVADPALPAAIARFAPDTLVHLAFAVQPGRDAAALRSANIDGTRRILEAAARVRPTRVLVASSATVYGAQPDRLAKDHPGQACPSLTTSASSPTTRHDSTKVLTASGTCLRNCTCSPSRPMIRLSLGGSGLEA